MNDLFKNSKLSPIELAKHIMTFKSLAETNSDYDKIKKGIIPDEKFDRVNQIISGLEQEDEFAILCRLMETCTSISKISQTPIIQNNEIIPDFIASFSPGCTITGKSKKDINVKYNCFIEVKSSKKQVFKISKNDLIKRKKYAQRYGMPLIFAVRFTMFERHGFWVLVDAKRVEKNGRKIDPTNFINNLNHVLFDDYFLMTNPSLHLIKYYDSSLPNKGLRHKDHGTLFKAVLVLHNEQPIELDLDNEMIVIAALNTFDLKEVEAYKENSINCIIYHIGNQLRCLSDILFRINRLAVGNDGKPVFDATRVLSRLDEDQPFMISRQLIEHIINFLNSKSKIFFLVGIGEPERQEKIIRSLGKRKGKPGAELILIKW